MAELKTLERLFSKDYHTAFEDLSTLIFCTELGLGRGVNRRINQRGIESDPEIIGSKKYAYQAKYYEASTTLSLHKDDLIKSIKEARHKGVTNLMIFINKNLPDTNRGSDEEVKYIKEIYEAANGSADEEPILLDWWTRSKIESSLDLPKFKYIRDIYFSEDNQKGYAEFYEYIYKKCTDALTESVYGSMSLIDSYIEPIIDVNGVDMNVKKYLEEWLDGNKHISVICGEPGQGKTSLCLMAMCDFYKKGWMTDKVSNVFWFSLNPALIDASENTAFRLDKYLSWGRNREDPEHIIKAKYCQKALIFFDGFDELIEWYPKFRLTSFLEKVILPFQEETGAYIILTSRNMAIKPTNYSMLSMGGKDIPIYRLQLISFSQQVKWIMLFIEYCRKTSPEMAEQYSFYLEKYMKMEEIDALQEILGIPCIFRMIVREQYLPSNSKVLITQIYDDLVHETLTRHEIKLGTESAEKEIIEKLEDHALRIFLNDNYAAVPKDQLDFSWLIAFYTKNQDENRVGFLHRSFYHYFLAKEILSWYDLYAKGDKNSDEFNYKLACLGYRRLDRTTLAYIKEIYGSFNNKEKLNESFKKAYNTLKETDGFLPSKHMEYFEQSKDIITLEKANNVFWNVISIGSICNHSVDSDSINARALQIYDLEQCILTGASLTNINLKKAYLSGVDFSGANLRDANLSEADLRGANLDKAILRGANLCKSDLREANLKEADFSIATLNKANLYRACLQNATLNESYLIDGYLRGADLKNAKLRKAILREADLRGANLCGADLRGADLLSAKLSGAILSKACLNRADFSNANLYGADFNRASVKGTSFHKTKLQKIKIDRENAEYLKSYGYRITGMKITDD